MRVGIGGVDPRSISLTHERLSPDARDTELDNAERAALSHGVTVRRGQGYTLHVTASLAVHRQLLARRQLLDGTQGTSAVPAQREAPASTRT
ncbi:hypothetical protein [Streptomyces sp. NPDC005209]|uniref:hypothetical protein n=1 Tax=Streptomyces sp. NPDC005209 TaxID=3156715 RepID=UPI0033B467CE